MNIPTIVDLAHVSDTMSVMRFTQVTKPIVSSKTYCVLKLKKPITANRSVRMAERLALPTSDHGVAGSNPAGGEILPEPKRRFIVQSLSCSPFHCLEMTEILLKGRKTLTHPSITAKLAIFMFILKILVEQSKFICSRGSISRRHLTITLSFGIYDSEQC